MCRNNNGKNIFLNEFKIDGGMDGWMSWWVEGEWLNEWMDESMDQWVGGCMGEWVQYRYIDSCLGFYL